MSQEYAAFALDPGTSGALLIEVDRVLRSARSTHVLLSDGTYECTLCGVVLDIPEDKVQLAALAELRGLCGTGAIVIEGREVHRCEFATAR